MAGGQAQAEHFLAQRIDRTAGVSEVAAGHQYEKFFAADASDHVTSTRRCAGHDGKLNQNLVTRLVTKSVVDGLEMIEVDQGNGQGLSLIHI